MPPSLRDCLQSHLISQRREGLKRGWTEIPEWVFPSETGTSALHPRNVERIWYRVRRKAHAKGLRALPLHSARHSWATWALQAGKNLRWVADQLGHSDPSLTLRTYAHAMESDETDLSFADFDGDRRRYTATDEKPGYAKTRKYLKINGDPGAIRTRDPQLRRLVLYPAELPGHDRR